METQDTKTCYRCQQVKPIVEFYHDKAKDWTENQCIECKRKVGRQYYYDNRLRVRERERLPETKEKRRAYANKRYKEDEEYRERAKANRKRSSDKPENKKKALDRQRKRRQERYKTDYEFRLRGSLRSRLRHALRYVGVKKTSKYNDLIGCDKKELTLYLESRWLTDMTWDNYGHGKGKWVVDHIIPVAAFDLMNPEDQKKCFHYTNLQPLWWEDNMSKGAKLADGTDVREYD